MVLYAVNARSKHNSALVRHVRRMEASGSHQLRRDNQVVWQVASSAFSDTSARGAALAVPVLHMDGRPPFSSGFGLWALGGQSAKARSLPSVTHLTPSPPPPSSLSSPYNQSTVRASTHTSHPPPFIPTLDLVFTPLRAQRPAATTFCSCLQSRRSYRCFLPKLAGLVIPAPNALSVPIRSQTPFIPSLAYPALDLRRAQSIPLAFY